MRNIRSRFDIVDSLGQLCRLTDRFLGPGACRSDALNILGPPKRPICICNGWRVSKVCPIQHNLRWFTKPPGLRNCPHSGELHCYPGYDAHGSTVIWTVEDPTPRKLHSNAIFKVAQPV
ncbi:hypothetical protein FA13DRAFT_346561 [Coprinellus micaceus]|uniref:Uncharacterized protein n=1 Tax=Coprinellus micaceus TaxID=71717 RepID=A0A4Y7SET7_COPMI|nr:hypothetical protein FA13DRAFT_346561 [Coprinellus micaceus]